MGVQPLLAAIRTWSSQTYARILSPTRPRRHQSAPGALPGKQAANLGKLTQHSRPTEIVKPSTLPPECFHTTKTPSGRFPIPLTSSDGVGGRRSPVVHRAADLMFALGRGRGRCGCWMRMGQGLGSSGTCEFARSIRLLADAGNNARSWLQLSHGTRHHGCFRAQTGQAGADFRFPAVCSAPKPPLRSPKTEHPVFRLLGASD